MVLAVADAVAVAAVVAGFVLLAVMLFLFQFVSLWLQASFSGVRLSLFDLIGMRLRKVDPRVIVLSRIRVEKARLHVSTAQLETHVLAGGRVQNVVSALIMAQKTGIELDWDIATAIDLAGRDIVDLVQRGVGEPKRVECTGERGVRARSQSGAAVRVKVAAYVRPCIARTVGGAGLDALSRRVVAAVEGEVARCADAKALERDPERLERSLMMLGLDQGTAFEVVGYESKVTVEE